MPERAAQLAATQKIVTPDRSRVPFTRPSSASPQLRSSKLHVSAVGNQAIQRSFHGRVLQTKLTINQPGDMFEQEADRVADTVMRMADLTTPPEPPMPNKPPSGLQRACSCGGSGSGECEECKTRVMSLQRSSAEASPSEQAPPIVDEVLSSSGGELEAAARNFMEDRFQHDFSDVRVHTDSRAAESARAVNARAYTVGRDLVFGPGQYAPHTSEGRRLLAHELTHVVQQGNNRLAPKLQRQVTEANFPGGGKVDDRRPGEHLLWNFDIGVTTLKPGHSAQIPRLAVEIKQALSRDPDARVDVEGQASLTGSRNDVLSQRRADSVKQALVQQGVDAARINIITVGSLESLPATTQENLARSRAVRVSVPAHLLLPQGPNKPPAPQPGGCQGTLAGDLTLDGADVNVNLRGLAIRIGAGDGTGNPPGMVISGGATVTPPACGKFVFLQNVMPFREIVYKDRSRNTFQTSSFVLDTNDPYPSQDFAKLPGTSVPTANDSPSQGIDTFSEGVINTVEVRDDFRMFLMFQPTGAARTVIQVAEWSWTALVKNSRPNEFFEGDLDKDAGASRVSPSSGKGRVTTDVPVLSPNVISLDWVTNTGGQKVTPPTFAEIHRRILDKLKPKANP